MQMRKEAWTGWLSVILIGGGLVLLGAGVWQPLSAEAWFWWSQRQGVVVSVDPVRSGDTPRATIVPVSREFGLVIEKLGVNETVAADVDATRAEAYLPVLERTAVAQARGTVAPGEVGVTYLFGHSTVNVWEIGRYRAPFTLLNKLDNGDRIVTFYRGERYDYTVSDRRIVAPTDVSVLRETATVATLVLQTCDPPGENSKRLLIIATALP